MRRVLEMEKEIQNDNRTLVLFARMCYNIISRKVIDDPISDRAKEIFEYICPKYGVTLEEWNHDYDHIHIQFRAQPKSELSKFINAYKSASSRRIKKEYPEIRQKLWKEAFWSQSFCLLSSGGAPIHVIRQYIDSQGEGVDGRRKKYRL